MTNLEQMAREAHDSSYNDKCGTCRGDCHPCTEHAVAAIMDVARRFAEKACRNMNNLTSAGCTCETCNDTVADAIAAAEKGEP